jgi:hypothetical protein
MPKKLGKESVHDILCLFFLKLAKHPPCWYSLFDVGTSVCTLSSLLGVSQDVFNDVFVTAGFLQIVKNRGPVFKPEVFLSFISSKGLAECVEFSQFTIGRKRDNYFRVGKKIAGPKILLPGNCQPQRKIASLKRFQKEIRLQLTPHFSSLSLTNSPSTSPSPPVQLAPPSQQLEELKLKEKRDLLHYRLKLKLFPLLICPELLVTDAPFWNPTEVEDALLEVVAEIRKRRDDELTEILETEKTDHSPETITTQFPVLNLYSIPIDDSRVQSNILKELYRLNKKVTKSSTMIMDLGNNIHTSLVMIPRSKNLDRLGRNDRKHGWLVNILDALSDGEEDGRQELVRNLLIYIGSRVEYRDCFYDATEELGVSIYPTIDAATTFAIQSSSNINYRQMRELRRNLKVALGHTIFSPEQKIKQLIGTKWLTPETGHYYYGKERIEWSAKQVDEIVCLYFSQLMNEAKTGSLKMEHVDLSVSIDHGKGYSRATLIIVNRWQEEDGVWHEREEAFALANAKCRKDNREILINTYATAVNEALKRIKESGIITIFRDVSADLPLYYTVLGNAPNNVDDELVMSSPIELWMSGDFLFFAIAVGKEGGASFWCHYCDLSHRLWQASDHALGEDWTLAKIIAHVEAMDLGDVNKKIAAERKGVRTVPIFDAIDIDHYVPCVLHMQIGAVNGVYENMVAESQAGCEVFTEEYYELEKQYDKAKHDMRVARDNQREFEQMHAQYERHLKRDIKRTNDEQVRHDMGAELMFIAEERKELKLAADVVKLEVVATKTAFEAEEKIPENSKAFGQPVRAGIEEIVKRHGIDRGAYHGGDIQGNGCRLLMTDCSVIVSEIQDYLLGLPDDDKHCTDEELMEVCEIHKRLLGHMDGFFSEVRAKRFHISDGGMANAEMHRQHVLSIWRYLKVSVTPKLHVMEDHAIGLCSQHNGFGDLGEDAGERAHQEETKNDQRVWGIKGIIKKETTKSQFESMKKHPKVQGIRLEFNIKSKRKVAEGTTRSAAENKAAKKQRRMERRDEWRSWPLIAGTMTTLREKKKARNVEAA